MSVGSPSYREECLLALPRPVPPATHLRGTAIVVSRDEVERRGLADRYWARIPAQLHAQIKSLTPLSWVEIDLAMVHYRAIDALKLSQEECIAIGRAAADRTQSVIMTTLVRGLRGSGNLSPATVMRKLDWIWGRMMQGGGVCVMQTGPKDLRCELHGAEFCELRYSRLAWIGYFENALAPTARRVVVKLLNQPHPHAVAYAVSWV